MDYEVVKRRERALREHIYLVDYPEKTRQDTITYKICGTRGVIYTVRVSIRNKLTCSCPDFETRELNCKHIFCLLHRMLKFPIQQFVETPTIAEVWNKACRDLTERFSADALPEQKLQVVLVDGDDAGPAEAPKEPQKKLIIIKQREWEGEECIICYETMTKNCKIVFCREQCGKSIHADCLKRWQTVGRHKTCIFCRAPWK
jgi:hypothetical protein